VSYLFFHSTQSFIFYSLSRLQRFRAICLTRTPESSAVADELPQQLKDDYYLYGAQRSDGGLHRVVWSTGVLVRRLLAHLPPRLARPALHLLSRHVVPRLRSEVSPTDFLEWAEEILRRRGASLIHAHFGPVAWRLLPLRERLGLPLVVSFLGDEITTDVGSWWSWWIRDGSERPDWPSRMRELFHRADLLLVEGPFMRERLIRLGCPPDKVKIQRIAIPVRQLRFEARRPGPDRKVVLVFAGRFCEQKGLIHALEAVRQLRAEGRDIELRLIGDETMTDGVYAARVHAFIRQHRLESCVRLLGFLNHDEYLREMASGQIFLHPSVVGEDGTSEGGAPTTILEAQALGMPVVSTLHCDIPYVTVPGESALLVPERDGQALAQALRDLLAEPERWSRMGRVGRRHVEAFHDIEKEMTALETHYLDLIGRAVDRSDDETAVTPRSRETP
jgi:colanic acid/amylovoran biosynthesis glycosyltransferase